MHMARASLGEQQKGADWHPLGLKGGWERLAGVQRQGVPQGVWKA
jgi:hypothetical protein